MRSVMSGIPQERGVPRLANEGFAGDATSPPRVGDAEARSLTRRRDRPALAPGRRAAGESLERSAAAP